jgi:uncharacterized protein (DUF111 family)
VIEGGSEVLVVGVGGGASVLAADACDRSGLNLEPVQPEIVESLRVLGYGAGTNDIPGRANVVKVVIGETLEKTVLSGAGQDVQLLEANVDDVSGEVIAHTIAELLNAGAHDAWATPIVMKKGRPAFTVHALCDLALTEKISAVLVSETGTLGLRGSVIQRWPQTREEKSVTVHGHTIRIKIGSDRIKVENDDAVSAARELSLPLREVLALAEQAAQLLN